MTFTMKHEMHGGNLPVAICYPEEGQTIYAEAGAMSWMSPNMKMETSAGSLGKALSRLVTKEKMFLNYYTAQGGPGMIAMASHLPGSIMAIEMDGSRGFILQKSSFLAATTGIEHEIIFQKKLGSGFFGGEGFILQRFYGKGTLFVEVDGSAWTTYLQLGQEIIVDTGYMAMMDDTCTMDVRSVPGLKNMVLGGEGLFNTVITGPGNVTLQSHPANQLAYLVTNP